MAARPQLTRRTSTRQNSRELRAYKAQSGAIKENANKTLVVRWSGRPQRGKLRRFVQSFDTKDSGTAFGHCQSPMGRRPTPRIMEIPCKPALCPLCQVFVPTSERGQRLIRACIIRVGTMAGSRCDLPTTK